MTDQNQSDEQAVVDEIAQRLIPMIDEVILREQSSATSQSVALLVFNSAAMDALVRVLATRVRLVLVIALQKAKRPLPSDEAALDMLRRIHDGIVRSIGTLLDAEANRLGMPGEGFWWDKREGQA